MEKSPSAAAVEEKNLTATAEPSGERGGEESREPTGDVLLWGRPIAASSPCADPTASLQQGSRVPGGGGRWRPWR